MQRIRKTSMSPQTDITKGAILQVLLVSAEGIDHANIIGSIIGNPAYRVIVECGTQTHTSKTSSESLDKIYWNEKFTFELPPSELETATHLKLKIVNEDYFSDGEFVGETIIFLKGIMVEGSYKGLIELSPAPFNVVLKDNTYKGQITIGLKYIPSIVPQMKIKRYVQEGNSLDKSFCKKIVSLWQMKWWRVFFSCKNGQKQN